MPIRSALIGAAIGLAFAVTVAIVWRTHGAAQYKAGYAQAQIDAAIAAAALTEGLQYERDQADAQYRGAVLARQTAQRDLVAARTELDRVLRAHGGGAKDTGASSRSNGAGADWIGGFSACYSEYADLATDAARWADQVNGLQGYVRAVRAHVK